jgi:uncharacterized protein
LAQYHTIDLARLGLSGGEGRRLDEEVDIGPLELGGQRYGTVPQLIPVRVDVSRPATGHALRLAFGADVAGPCMRCLEDACLTVAVEAREVDQAGGGEEMASPYVDAEVLDLGGWAREALMLALPAQILCRPDCAGLCPVCGAPLNDADPAEHEHGGEAAGPFAKLSRLGRSSEEL